MAERPPGDGDEPPHDGEPTAADWTELMDQVEQALDQAGVLGQATREALRSALGEAFLHLPDLHDVDIQIDVEQGADLGPLDTEDAEDGLSEPPEIGAPDVTVVDGGRRRHEPRSPHPRPDLRVAPGRAPKDPPADTDPPPARTLQVFRGRLGGPRISGLEHEGRIQVAAEGRQAIYRGQASTPYRLACDEGRLAVSVDGVTVETLSAGQSLDVEGAVVVVLAADELAASGRYARLT